MPDTADHRAEMHQLATERRKAGKPIWDRKVNLADVFHNEDITFEQRRDAIVTRIRTTPWFKGYDEYDDLPQFVEELADAADAAEFRDPWDCIYDIADADRVWIATF
jgi:hypothetical protein